MKRHHFAGVGLPQLILLTFVVFGTVASAHAQLNPGSLVGFNPQPDPPGFGLIPLQTNQTIRFNVVCFEHQVGLNAPEPCRGEIMFHDAAGNMLRRARYDLRPGQSTFLELTDATVRFMAPCVLPEAGGRAIPSVEVFDNRTGRAMLFAHPAAARMSEFNNGFTDPGSLVGFNPQPDPPGFGLVTLAAGQALRLNVACFEHSVNGLPPGPCRGVLMFHDAAGNLVNRGVYDLRPGEATSLIVRDLQPGGILPCILPEAGGRAVPNLEVIDASSGDTTLLINPIARMSQFQKR